MWTLPEVAAQLGVAAHRLEHLVLRRSIAPAGRVGRYRVYGPAEVALIRNALAEGAASAKVQAVAPTFGIQGATA